MCPSMKCLLQDQHEQWKRYPEKPLRRYCLLFIIYFILEFFLDQWPTMGHHFPFMTSSSADYFQLFYAFWSVKVFRCQLPRINPLYSSESPKSDGSSEPAGSGGQFTQFRYHYYYYYYYNIIILLQPTNDSLSLKSFGTIHNCLRGVMFLVTCGIFNLIWYRYRL